MKFSDVKDKYIELNLDDIFNENGYIEFKFEEAYSKNKHVENIKLIRTRTTNIKIGNFFLRGCSNLKKIYYNFI
jgi:hypothetical protein